MHNIPQFNAAQLCGALVKLGFKECPAGKHQHKYKHPERTSKGRMPFFVFPDNIAKKRQFQKALIRDLTRLWGYTLAEVLEALK